tara:strand:+ start:153 stop:473 length:321 start_codon:yes stop_codon:yes gene_type:complete
MKRLLLLSALLVATQPAMAAYKFLLPRAVDGTLKCLDTMIRNDCAAAERALDSLRSYANSKGNAMCGANAVLPLVDIGMMQVGILPTEDEKLKIFEYLGEMEESCK